MSKATLGPKPRGLVPFPSVTFLRAIEAGGSKMGTWVGNLWQEVNVKRARKSVQKSETRRRRSISKCL